MFASRHSVDVSLLLSTLLGIGLVIGAACVFNNYIDRDIDTKMKRTKKRALVSGIISGRAALTYGCVLALVGFLLLAYATNAVTVVLGLVGFVDYVMLYGLSKRRWSSGTIIGSIAGATPIAAGYTAVTNRFDTAAVLLFLILVFWQMPHFYAIALRRLKEYKAAGLPVLPVSKGARSTKLAMFGYTAAFVVCTLVPAALGYVGFIYLAVMALFGLKWLSKAVDGFKTNDDVAWAKSMFLFSLIILLVFCLSISVGARLP